MSGSGDATEETLAATVGVGTAGTMTESATATATSSEAVGKTGIVVKAVVMIGVTMNVAMSQGDATGLTMTTAGTIDSAPRDVRNEETTPAEEGHQAHLRWRQPHRPAT